MPSSSSQLHIQIANQQNCKMHDIQKVRGAETKRGKGAHFQSWGIAPDVILKYWNILISYHLYYPHQVTYQLDAFQMIWRTRFLVLSFFSPKEVYKLLLDIPINMSSFMTQQLNKLFLLYKGLAIRSSLRTFMNKARSNWIAAFLAYMFTRQDDNLKDNNIAKV